MKPLKLLRSLRRNLWRDVCVRAQTLSPGEVEAWALGRAKLLARKAGLDVEWGSPLGKALEQLLAVLVRELVEEAVELAAVQLEDPHEFAEGLAEALGSLPLLEGPAPASRPDPSRDVTPLSELPAAEAVTMDPLPARPGVVQWIRGRLGLGEGSGAVARARLEALTEREAPTLLDGEA